MRFSAVGLEEICVSRIFLQKRWLQGNAGDIKPKGSKW